MCVFLNNVWYNNVPNQLQFSHNYSGQSYVVLYISQSVGLTNLCVNLSHVLHYISLFSRPSHWWRSTPSSKMTSMCLMRSGWQKMTALKKLKKVSLHLQQGFTFTFTQSYLGCSSVYIHILFNNACFQDYFSELYSHSQSLHMEVIKPGQLWMQTFFTTSLRFSVFIVKHDPLCWSRAEQNRAELPVN